MRNSEHTHTGYARVCVCVCCAIERFPHVPMIAKQIDIYQKETKNDYTK